MDLNAEYDKDLEGLKLEEGLVDNSHAFRWLVAGKCICTFVHTSGKRFTYKVVKPRGKNKKVFYVSVLTGPNNTKDYTYIGYIKVTDINGIIKPDFIHGKDKTNITDSAESVTFLRDILEKITPWYLFEISSKLNRTQNIYKAKRFVYIPDAENYAASNGLKDYIILPLKLGDNKEFYVIQKKVTDNTYTMYRSSHCCRCGRLLTVDESIIAGMGKQCASMYAHGEYNMYF